MPEFAVNAPLSSRECVEQVFRKIDKLMADGICELCALRLASVEYDIDFSRLLTLYVERELHERQ